MTDTGYPHLSRAPATEAVIDVRVQPRTGAGLASLRSLAEDGYSVEETQEYSSTIELTPDGPQISQHGQARGFRFASSDGRVIVSASLSGIATSRLQPYTDWNDLLRTAREFYDRYVRLVRPGSAVRLGVRYINRLDLPANVMDLARFLVAPPQPLPGTTGRLNGFLRRAVTTEEGGVTAIVTQVLQEVYERRTVLIFDIDCALTRAVEPQNPAIWDAFADLRARKNGIFFDNLRPETVEMYK